MNDQTGQIEDALASVLPEQDRQESDNQYAVLKVLIDLEHHIFQEKGRGVFSFDYFKMG